MRGLLGLLLCALMLPALATAEDSSWSGYLDYAYVYSSAEPEALGARLTEYGNEAGIRLEDHVRVAYSSRAVDASPDPETEQRRAAIAHLLLYLASGDTDHLDESVDAISELSDNLERHENRYWYHYILAHRALERDARFDFVGETLDLWLHAVAPLETPYDTLHTLSLSDAPGSGFVSALPYLYENTARLILIRRHQKGVDRDLDPLGAIVRMLYDGRVGTHPDVIPIELSSRAYLERIVRRLDGPESDAGSLTFTLALFGANEYHNAARAMLAEEGLSPGTLKALRVSSGAYQAALDRAVTLQGEASVHTRVLRQLGEVYAAKQRLGVDPEIESPFSIEDAIDVYQRMREGEEDLDEMGFRSAEDYVTAAHALWEEIQESSLNAADFYLTRAMEDRARADDYARSAARLYARYLAFFQRHATGAERDAVPDSAYFAAHEAARGYGDALLSYAGGRLSPAEMRNSVERYVAALSLFPFDRAMWPALAAALARQGRESQYLELARPVAERVTSSRQVDGWIQAGEPGAEPIATMRRALGDSQVLVYLGFAAEETAAELEASLAELRAQRDENEGKLARLTDERASMGRTSPPAAPDPDESATPRRAIDAFDVEALDREIERTRRQLLRQERQIVARTDALPLFQATVGTETLVDDLRRRRDHPVHSLLRRMHHEKRR